MNQKKRRERITSSEAKEAYKEASKFFLDIAKLVFAGVILASVMNMSVNDSLTLTFGILSVIALMVLGGYLYYLALKKY
jgi:uncharacterized membrane protein YraQ (UPF0718 family)